MGHSGPILDHQYTFASDQVAIFDKDRAGCVDHDRLGVQCIRQLTRSFDLFKARSLNLVDDEDVGHAQIDLAGEIARAMVGAVRDR